MNNDQKTILVRVSDQDEPVLLFGMQRIIDHQGQGISKGRAGLIKRDVMEFNILLRLVRVPHKTEHSRPPSQPPVPLLVLPEQVDRSLFASARTISERAVYLLG
ncbi:MAG TPA: hypothetical protein PLU87_01105 [Sedimentisphaerales bacterium]|nr:hypothetical protein [Sedimentisphaerales bacterium]